MNYELDIKDIIQTNVKPTDTNTKLSIIVYYKNPKTCNLVMKNNLSPPLPQHLKTNVVYSFKCPFAHGNVQEYEYIGLTSVSLQKRIQQHTYKGSIKLHYLQDHNIVPSKTQLIDNTTILTHAEDRYRLSIKEALLILKNSPLINKQFDNFTNILKLHKSRNNHPIHNNNHSDNTTNIDNSTIHVNSQSSPTISSPIPILSQPNEISQSPMLRHPASPQIIHHINQLFSNSHDNSNTPHAHTRYNFRNRPIRNNNA